MEAGALGAQLLDAQAGGIVEVQAVAVGTKATGLPLDMGHLLEAAGQVAAAQVGIRIAGDFAGHHALHELQGGHFEAEGGGVLAVVGWHRI